MNFSIDIVITYKRIVIRSDREMSTLKASFQSGGGCSDQLQLEGASHFKPKLNRCWLRMRRRCRQAIGALSHEPFCRYDQYAYVCRYRACSRHTNVTQFKPCIIRLSRVVVFLVYGRKYVYSRVRTIWHANIFATSLSFTREFFLRTSQLLSGRSFCVVAVTGCCARVCVVAVTGSCARFVLSSFLAVAHIV